MPATLLRVTPFLLAAGASVLPGGVALRCTAVGVALISLATTAASLVTGSSASFHTINNALLWCGLMLCGMALVGGWKQGVRALLAPLAIALVATVLGCRPLLFQGHVVVSLLAGLAGATALGRLRITPALARSRDAGRPAVPEGFLRRWGMTLLLGAFLLPAFWFAATVAGPEGMSVAGFRDAPFSSAAETLLAALILPATILLAGTWPFGPLTRGPRFAPLGALLLVLVVGPVLGEGLEHWRSLYAGWLVLGAFVAASRARWPQLMACAGLFAIACGGGSIWWAGTLLTVVASLLARLSAAEPRATMWLRVGMFTAAACGIAALGVTLGVEVVYSTAMVFATAIALLRTPFSPPSQ